MEAWPNPALALAPIDAAEDNATLHAALAFVDEYELSEIEGDNVARKAGDWRTIDHLPLDNDELVGSLSLLDTDDGGALAAASVSAVASPLVDTTEAAKPTVNRSRNRQKQELVYLRSKVEELEERLVALKKKNEEERVEDVTTVVKHEPLALAWEELAARQYEQRQRAEVENVKLKTMLEEQIRVAKNLERLLKKRTMAEFMVSSAPKRLRKTGSSRLDEEGMFDDLQGMISAMYAEVDQIFADERYQRKTPSLRDIQARVDDVYGTVVEVFDARVNPFSMQDISEAIWHHMVYQSFDFNSSTSRVVKVTDDMFMREFGASLDLPRMKGEIRGKITARRFVEEDRIVILSNALLDPEKVSNAPMDGMFIRTKMYTVLRRPPPEFIRSDRAASLGQTYHMIIPEFQDDDELSADHGRRKVGTLTNFVLNSIDFHLEMGRQMIENLLLETSWKTPSAANSPQTSESS